MPHSDMGALSSTWSVICIFNLFAIKAFDGFFVSKGDLILNPASVVPKGSNVSVTCRLKAKDPCLGKGNFVFDVNGNYRYPDSKNRTWSALQLPGVSGDHHIICYMECGRKNPITDTKLKVGYPPDKPSNISCSLGELSSEMTCAWDGGRETELDTSYGVRADNLQNEETNVESKVSSVKIAVNRTRDRVIRIQVTARNQLNDSVSDVVLVRLSDIVVPITPVISKIQLLLSTFYISIIWRKPTSERRSYCEVQYKSLTDPSWRTIGQTVNINNSIEVTKTQSAESLRVRCREETGRSYWSHWSFPLRLPPSAPVGAPNVWRILGPEYPNRTREVIILIKKDNDEIPQRTISGYKVLYMDNKNLTTLRTCALSELECVTLVPKGVKMIFVSTLNSYGISPTSNVSTQEESDFPSPRNLTATTSWPMELRWESAPSTGQTPLGYILQWNPDTCDGKPRNVSWKKLTKNTTHISLNETILLEERVAILLFAVYSAGVSRPISLEFKPESGPDSIEIEKIFSNTLIVRWSEVPMCKRRGVNTTYTLNVTELSGRLLHTYYSAESPFTFKEYYPDRRYSVCVSASTKAGEGPNSCAFIEADKILQSYFGALLGTCLGAFTFAALVLALSMIRKRIKSTLMLWLPKYLHEEYPNVGNSVAAKCLQEKREDLGSFLNPSYNDPEITDVQEALTYAIILRGTAEAHPLLQTTTGGNMVELVHGVGPRKPTTDVTMVEHMVEDGQALQSIADKITEYVSGHHPRRRNMEENMGKDGPTLHNVIEHVSGYRPTEQSMAEHMANVGPPFQTTNMAELTSGYRPQTGPQTNLHSPDAYCSPFQLMDIHREASRLGSSTDGLDRNDTFQIDFSLFQGMDLQVLNDGTPEEDPASTMTTWSEHQKCSQITGIGDILSGHLICHLPPDCGELQDANPYFPQIYARGT